MAIPVFLAQRRLGALLLLIRVHGGRGGPHRALLLRLVIATPDRAGDDPEDAFTQGCGRRRARLRGALGEQPPAGTLIGVRVGDADTACPRRLGWTGRRR